MTKEFLITSDKLSSTVSECDGEGSPWEVVFKMLFSLSLLASIRACSNKALASWLSSLMNFKGDGQTSGSVDDGFSKAAQVPCLCFKAIT